MNKSNRIWWILGGIAIALGVLFFVAKKSEWIGKKEKSEVEFSKVVTANLTETVSASGKIQPEVEVKITPDVPGEIIALYVKEGDSVKKGQLLLKIQPENYLSVVDRFKAGVNQSRAAAEQSKSSIARAESQMLRSQMEFVRQKKLFEDKVISKSDFETAETNLKIAKQDLEAAKSNFEAAQFGIKSAEANLKDASENLRKTNIYAPMNGIVSKLDVELGERVVGTSQMAGTEIMRIANLNNMEVRVNVNENDIVRVNLGDTVIIDVDAYSVSGKKFKGIVTEIANTANGSLTATNANSTESVTEFEVRIKILPSSYRELISQGIAKKYPFKPGMTATVDIITETKTNVLAIPIAAVTTRNGSEESESENPEDEDDESLKKIEDSKDKQKEVIKEMVFVKENDKAKSKEVKTGITDTVKGLIEIKEGLKLNQEIISGPYIEVSKRLKDGVEVTKKIEKKEDKKE